jgi:hypothetical protein
MEALADLGISGLVRSPERFVRLLDVKVRPPLTRRPRPNVCPTFPISSDTRQSTCSSSAHIAVVTHTEPRLLWVQQHSASSVGCKRRPWRSALTSPQHQMVLPIAKEILQPKDGRGQDVAFLTLWLGACP